MHNSFELFTFGMGNDRELGDMIYIHYVQDGVERSIVYDCGTRNGITLLEKIMHSTGREHIDDFILSHPDKDHAEFAAELLDRIPVKRVWAYLPSDFANELYEYVKDGRMTRNSLALQLREKYPYAEALFDAAKQQSIPINEPTLGANIGKFQIVGPSRESYVSLLKDSSKTPKMLDEVTKSISEELVDECYELELLTDSEKTTAENAMSLILTAGLANIDILLTGDSGVTQMHEALRYAKNKGHHGRFSVVQLPHHGSRHNMTKTLMNELFGDINEGDSQRQKIAIVTAPDNSHDHPHGHVVNAGIRRGVQIFRSQQEGCFLFSINRQWPDMPAAKPLEFQKKVKK